ncbi:MAG TPA: MBG domain-containing protein, partial [Acidimicrobiia bacterium]|nr:MBG domain-containing protein [Acidimicrobiia bacterium]
GTIIGIATGTNVSGGRYEADAFRPDRIPPPGVYDLGVFVAQNGNCLQVNPTERSVFTYFPQVLETTTALAVSPPSPQTYATEQTFTATVDTVPPGGPVPTEWGLVPTGNVQFQVDSDGDGVYENRGDPVALNSEGTASIALTLPAGAHAVRAVYLGDPSGAPDFGGSTGEQPVTVEPKALAITADDKAVQYSDPLPALTVGYDGFVLDEGPGVLTGTLTCETSASVNAAGQVQSPAGSYAITCSGLSAGNYAITFVPGALTVTAEDTVVRLAQSNPHAVSVVKIGKKTQSPEMTFTARITGVTDGSYGDIGEADPVTLTLDPVSDGGPVTATCTVDRVQPATATDPGFELVTCTVDQGDTPINVYLVTLTVGGGYYQGGDSSVLTVYDPTAGGTTGAGIITNPQTRNTADIAYATRYLKNSKQVQGKFLYVSRDQDGDVVHVLKGNVMSTMAITGITAMVTGKATLDGVGNYSYILTGIDNRTAAEPNPPATPDRYGQRVTDSAGATVNDLTFDPVVVTEGNIYVGK